MTMSAMLLFLALNVQKRHDMRLDPEHWPTPEQFHTHYSSKTVKYD